MRLSEKEFEIINVVGDGFRTNQRFLSTRVGISLGMTNLLLRRLVLKGYLRARQLTPKKIEYLLTPRGLSEKTRKSLQYTLKTIESFGLVGEKLRFVLQEKLTPNIREISIVGEGHFLEFAWLVIKDFVDERIKVTRLVNSQLHPFVGADTLLLYLGKGMNFSHTGPGQTLNMITLLSDRGSVESRREQKTEKEKVRMR